MNKLSASMKAKVIATGKIINCCVKDSNLSVFGILFVDVDTFETYYDYELDFSEDIESWENLRNQYAGMAMQAILNAKAEEPYEVIDWGRLASLSVECANALIKELKKE